MPNKMRNDKRFLGVDDERWTEALMSAQHDFYALPCFAKLDALWSSGRAAAYYNAESNILIPLVYQHGAGGGVNAVSPYGYPGIIGSGSSDVLRATIVDYVDAGLNEGFVTSFIRLHPLLNERVPLALQELESCKCVKHGPTVSVSLLDSEETWIAKLSKGLRRDIRVLQQKGYYVEFNGPDSLDAFVHCYRASMRRVGAEEQYLFDERYVSELIECLGPGIVVCVVKSSLGHPACAGLFTCTNRIVQYHLSGTSEEHLAMGPNKLMIVAARTWARQQGAELFHLGGGVGARDDGLLRFKRRFGQQLSWFWTLRIVHDKERYDVLHSEWLRVNGLREAPDPDFFPVYSQKVIIQDL